MDESSFISDAIVPNQGLQITAGGQMQIPNSGITTALIGNNQVTTSKIANLDITTAKIANSAVTTDKIANSNVTTAKILNANVTAEKLNGEQTGSAPIYGIRAWIGFNGTGSNPIFIDTDGNIASVSKVATGEYTITFTTPMDNDGYVLIGSTSDSSGEVASVNFFDKTVSSFKCKTYAETPGLFDFSRVYIMVII
jgi:hypothetical protein